jgi:hypothetical protein
MKWRNARRVVLTNTAEQATIDNATPTTKRAPFGLPAPSSFETRTLGHEFNIVRLLNSLETGIAEDNNECTKPTLQLFQYHKEDCTTVPL